VRLTLRQLRAFDAVARLGHFGRAAEVCAVSQPALSVQVRELERELGLRLIERRRDGARLTEDGREIARRAADLLDRMRGLEDAARRRRGPPSGPLRLGVIPTVAPYLLPGLIARLRAAAPDMDLRIREATTDHLLGALSAGEIDVALAALPLTRPGIETAALFEDRFLLAAPEGRDLTARPRATPELLLRDRLLLLEEGHCLRDQALAVCALRAADGFDAFGASSLTTIVQMVAAGLGLTLLPEIAVAAEGSRPGVRLLRFEPPEPRRVLGLAWRTAAPRGRDVEALAEALRAMAPTRA
jgi:LysR family hydrogen peroxide-inducible transcriptional activator